MKNVKLLGVLIILLPLVLVSCKTEEIIPGITAFRFTNPVDGLGIIDENAKTIEVNVPYGTDLSNVIGTITATDGATISPDITSGVDFSSLSVPFTLTLEDQNITYTVNVIVGPNPLRLALVGEAAEVDGLTNDEVKTAYQWALDTYQEKAGYVSFADLTEEFIATAEVVWIHYQTEVDGGAGEVFELPADMVGNALPILTQFYQDGGNMLLTTHAIPYLVNLGRVSEDFGPTAIGAGPGAIDNPDNWGISYQEGFFEDGQYPTDNDSYYLFNGLTTSDVTFEGVTYPAVFLSAPGTKKDDAALWDFNNLVDRGIINTQFGCDDPNAAKAAFEQATNSTVRASFEWDPAACGIELGTIIEFNPEGAYQGTALCIGPGAYEWHRQDGVTQWLDNVSGITQNYIDNFVQ